MRRRTWLAISGVALVTGCSAVLGIHDPEIVAALEAGAADPGDAEGPADAGADSAVAPSAMVTVPRPDAGGTFQIDVTEVTQAEYAEFLAHGTDSVLQHPACTQNLSFRPAAAFTPRLTPTRPVTAVDWCDAYAYCQWTGKRLCGAAGEPGAFTDLTVVARSEWLAACTRGGAQGYPYGTLPRPTACNTPEVDAGTALDVGAKPFCEGGYTGVFDLVGNAAEWVDLCDDTQCAVMGGSYSAPSDTVASCTTARGYGRLTVFADVGFRCCR